MAKKPSAPVKTYVLLAHTESTAPHYLRVSQTERVQFTKRPIDHAYGQETFTDEEGNNRTIRLRLDSNTIWLDEQVKAGFPATITGRDGMPMNVPPSTQVRAALQFTNGVLMTGNKIVQEYLENSPQYDGFKGERSGSVKKPLYALYDKKAEIKSDNQDFKDRLRAANKIMGIDNLEEAQNLLILLNGTHFKVPGIKATTEDEKADALQECQNLLMNFLSDANDAMLKKLLDDSVTVDEEINILISRAISKDILSFYALADQVAIKREDTWLPVKMVSSELSQVERERFFAEFLVSSEGALLRNDIQKQLGITPIEKKTTKKKAEVA